MPKKSAKQTDSDEDYAEAQSQPELDPGSLEAVLARVIGPLQAQLAEQGLAQAKLAEEFAEAKAASEAKVIGVGSRPRDKPPIYVEPEAEPEAKATPPGESRQQGPFEGFEKEARGLESEEIADKLFARFLAQQDAQKALERKVEKIIDSIPFLKTGLEYPERIFREQEAGNLVVLDLLRADEYKLLIPGYELLAVGTRAELEYGFCAVKRLDDVLGHLETGLMGESEIDLSRVGEICFQVRNLLSERVEGISERAFVKKDNPIGESDEQVVHKMDLKRLARMRPKRSGAFSIDQSQQQLIDTAYAKKVAAHKADLLFKASGLGKPGRDPKKQDGNKKKKDGAGTDKPAAGT